MKRLVVLAALLAAVLACASCQATATIGEAQVPAAGSAPAGPSVSASGEPEPVLILVECEKDLDLGKMLSWMYEKRNENVNIQFKAGDLSDGIENLKAGDAQAALFWLNGDELSEYGDMRPEPFFSDGIAVIVNESNSVEGLTSEQLSGILTGKITDWVEVGGAAGQITVYAGLAPYGRQIDNTLGITLGNMSENYTSYNGDYGCEAIRNEAGGISFTSLASAAGKNVKVLKLNGTAPSGEAVMSGAYTLKRDYYLISGGDEETQKFIDYCLEDPDVAAYIYDKGYIKP
jgi:phosphate transport system substrate-binding protein